MSGAVNQEYAFLKSLGDDYFERNYSNEKEEERLKNDRIVDLHSSLGLAPPKSMLEIGCMTGFRCELFRRRFKTRACGLEPSAKAIAIGKRKYPEVRLDIGIASSIPYAADEFDCVILGNFCYWVDRERLFEMASSIDRVLANKGIIYMLDFDPVILHKNRYIHNYKKKYYTYKMHHYKMFTWNPIYSIIYQCYYDKNDYRFQKSRNDCSQITVLRKDLDEPFKLENPFTVD